MRKPLPNVMPCGTFHGSGALLAMCLLLPAAAIFGARCHNCFSTDYYLDSPAGKPRVRAEREQHLLRGGHWAASPEACTSSCRHGQEPGSRDACFLQPANNNRSARIAATELPADAKVEQPGTSEGRLCLSLANTAVHPTVDSSQSQPPAATGFVYGDVYLRHITGPGHPERPERLTAIVEQLRTTGLQDRLVRIEPRSAERRWLLAVHTTRHIAALEQASSQQVRFAGSPDTPICEASFAVATEAAGGVLAAIDAVVAGAVRNAFCAVRPPGHHATTNKAMGFCLLNNVAIAARYIQRQKKLPKVLIVDWDVHHGNGTQDIFYEDPCVFYFSVHQYPFYPGTGGADQQGAGEGKGFTLNVPLPAGSGDRDFEQAFAEKLVPAARQFKPDFVLISAGFDAHQNDPLGGMRVTADGYGKLTRIVKQIAEENCHGRLVSVLEGGYSLDGLAASVETHLRSLLD